MSVQAVFLRLAVAALLGSLVGFERHLADKSAGMRTHLLVSLGSALVMIVSAHAFNDVLSPGRIVLDPSRIAAQVVSGIGFLGAGMILRQSSQVHGLTTAAGLWAIAGVGLAAGGGLYFVAFAATALILLTLTAIKPLEERLDARHERHTLNLLVKQQEFSIENLESILKGADLAVKGLSIRRAQDPGERRVIIQLGRASRTKMLTLVERLHTESSICEVGFHRRRT